MPHTNVHHAIRVWTISRMVDRRGEVELRCGRGGSALTDQGSATRFFFEIFESFDWDRVSLHRYVPKQKGG